MTHIADIQDLLAHVRDDLEGCVSSNPEISDALEKWCMALS
jgi:hypothetical protein